ncbi:hypothetical protein JOD67_003899 [Tenggerimyces flavus]|nr:hypothetical protein [Tenggerimyces flavus]
MVVAGPGRVKGASQGRFARGERRRFAIFDP